jgi:ankyrin repeat protein
MPLHLAARGGHGGLVRLLLKAGSDPAAVTTNSGVTALHLAAAAIEGEDAIAALLRAGADPNALERSAGQSPLMFAAGASRVAAVRALLEAGAEPGISTRVVDVLSNLTLDRQAKRRFQEMLGVTPEAEALREECNSQVPIAACDGVPTEIEPASAAEVQAAVRAQREFLLSGHDLGDVDPYTLASVRPEYPGGPDVARPPWREALVGKTGGLTALLHAAREGNIDSAVALLEGGADVDQVGGDGSSPLLMATFNGHFDLALLLLEAGADPDRATATDGIAPLFAVLQTQWAPKTTYPQPRAQDEQRAEHLEVLEALLVAGADPDVRLRTHMWYWEYGLMKMGLDLTGATPFWRAAFAQDIEAMKLLVTHGADPDIPTAWPEVGMRQGRQQDGRLREDSGLPKIPQGAPNVYPIHAAAGGGYLGLGAFSVQSRPDQFLAAVSYLVEEHGADVNFPDSWLYRPLHYAASRGDNELIEYLVSQGADVTAITRLGQSTADMARGGQAGFFKRAAYPETVEFLTSLGSTLECLNTHFRGSGDACDLAGANDPWASPAEGPAGPTSEKSEAQ